MAEVAAALERAVADHGDREARGALALAEAEARSGLGLEAGGGRLAVCAAGVASLGPGRSSAQLEWGPALHHMERWGGAGCIEGCGNILGTVPLQDLFNDLDLYLAILKTLSFEILRPVSVDKWSDFDRILGPPRCPRRLGDRTPS